MKVARRPTTTPSASMWIHFFSTSAGFSEAVVLFSITRGPWGDGRNGLLLPKAGTSGRRADRGAGAARQRRTQARDWPTSLFRNSFVERVLKYHTKSTVRPLLKPARTGSGHEQSGLRPPNQPQIDRRRRQHQRGSRLMQGAQPQGHGVDQGDDAQHR